MRYVILSIKRLLYCIVLYCIAQLFVDCTHQTIVGECLSPSAELLSGVMQGNGIGPVLFLIYIDNLAKKLLERNGLNEIIRG